MKKTYIVAGNPFSVEFPADLPAWRSIEPRFRPFAATAAPSPDEIGLQISISNRLPEPIDAQKIYEPEFGGIGFISSFASRMPDGSIAIDFRHIDETQTRLRLIMSPGFRQADIIAGPADRSNDTFFLTHALMLAFMMAFIGNGTLLLHSSAIIHDGKAYLFQGKSGTGKSTHARLWLENVEGAELLNDDHPVLRFAPDGTAVAYGSPWSGKTHCYRNVSAPLGAMVRIVRAADNELRRLPPLRAYASLTPSIFSLPYLPERTRDIRHRQIERLATTIPCYEMHCRPDADAALRCREGLEKDFSR